MSVSRSRLVWSTAVLADCLVTGARSACGGGATQPTRREEAAVRA